MKVQSQNALEFASTEDVLNTLKNLLQIECTAGSAGKITEEAPLGENIKEAIDYVLNVGKLLGFRTKALDGYSGYVEMGPEDAEELVAIIGHVDTVPTGDGWTKEPFDLTVEDGKMYGRGTNDDKGPVIASLYAMKAVQDSGIPLNKRVRLIVGGDEENGDWRCMERYKETEQLPDYAFSPDANYPLIFAEKGILHFDVVTDEGSEDVTIDSGTVPNIVPEKAEASVVGKEYKATGVAAHAMEPEKGDNALLKLARTLKEEGVNHPFIELLNNADRENFDIELSDEVSGELTLNPAIAHLNKDGAVLTCDVRYPVTLDGDEIIDRISKAVKAFGPFEVKLSNDVKPLYVDQDSELVTKLLDVYNKATGSNEKAIAVGGGTYARAFDNAVAFGVIFPGKPDMCHQKDEYWPLDDMLANIQIIADAIIALAK